MKIKPKVGVVSCSGECCSLGTLVRVATRLVLEEYKPDVTVTICLPLFLAGEVEEHSFAKDYPTIAVDGCGKLCAKKAIAKYSKEPADSVVVEDIPRAREDAFVGALNGCFMFMFIWAAERLKIDLVSYECEAEGHVEEFLDRTSAFDRIELRPKIVARGCTIDTVGRALKLAEKYSLIWQSIKAEVVLKPEMNMK